MSGILHFFRDESGATAIEYGLICALIVIAASGAMVSFAGQVDTMYAFVIASMAAAG